MQTYLRLSILIFLSAFLVSCQREKPNPPANLSVQVNGFSSELVSTFLDLPDGVYQPDNPDFHPNKPETWTGNMAQYVKQFYSFTVNYSLNNSGRGIAFDTEIDFNLEYSNGEDEIITGYLGDVQPGATYQRSTTKNAINKKLVGCTAEVYWFD